MWKFPLRNHKSGDEKETSFGRWSREPKEILTCRYVGTAHTAVPTHRHVRISGERTRRCMFMNCNYQTAQLEWRRGWRFIGRSLVGRPEVTIDCWVTWTLQFFNKKILYVRIYIKIIVSYRFKNVIIREKSWSGITPQTIYSRNIYIYIYKERGLR